MSKWWQLCTVVVNLQTQG